ncbi:glucose-6-phosphate dehydrogenase [Candidatus Uhrbacteria bacterium]|nr:glucose-6-phosphate dehydrogenase [Candidatus Uhrbacteria bacterium]
MPQKPNIPTVLIILGATGDLMTKKVIPALFYLHEQSKLPEQFKIIGFSRRDLTDEHFKTHIIDIVDRAYPGHTSQTKAAFLDLFLFQRGNFDVREDFGYLAKLLGAVDSQWGVCANKLFYLAVHPNHFETIFTNMAHAGLTIGCGPNEGWTRVIVEKPFGNDLSSAKQLDDTIRSYFQEEQIYRIDHYPAKEVLQNILSFRFSNKLFEQSWNNEHIESVHIRLWETLGVEKRGAFYDAVGALRDMGQNHVLQIIALLTMDHPESYHASSIRKKRAEILERLVVPTRDEVLASTYRAQYHGYRSIANVHPASETETYFRARAYLDTPRWCGVPFIFESGKRLGEARKEIIVTFKHPSPCLCLGDGHHLKNIVTFHIEPEERLSLQLGTKKPGLLYDVEERMVHMPYSQGPSLQYAANYAKLLYDAIVGDQTLFTSTEEIHSTWRFIDPIIEHWNQGVVPLAVYTPDTNEPIQGRRTAL